MSSEFLLGHHPWGAGFKTIYTTWALLGKENLWDWICKRREGVGQLPLSHREECLVQRASAPGKWVCVPLEGYCFLSLKPFIGQKWEGSLSVEQYTGDLKWSTSHSLDSFGVASCPAPEVQMANGIWGMCTLGDTSGLVGSWVWEQSLPWGVGTSPGLR